MPLNPFVNDFASPKLVLLRSLSLNARVVSSIKMLTVL